MALAYHEIQAALLALFPLDSTRASGSETGFKNRFMEAGEKELMIGNMPMVNVRLPNSDLELTSIPDGYHIFVNFEVDVITFDFTSFEKAAILRDKLLKVAQEAVLANLQFHNDIQTSSIRPRVDFGVFSQEGAGGHIAIATFTVVAEADVQI